MRQKLTLAIGSLCGSVATLITSWGLTPPSAQPTRTLGADYIGLWEGIDEVDGGNSLRSIMPDAAGFKVIGRDSWHGPCGYGDPAVGISRVEMDGASLKGTLTLDCQAGETADTGDRSFKVRYTYNEATQTLVETFLDPDTEAPVGRPPIVFFRQSPPIAPSAP